jgi:hypothetical protein
MAPAVQVAAAPLARSLSLASGLVHDDDSISLTPRSSTRIKQQQQQQQRLANSQGTSATMSMTESCSSVENDNGEPHPVVKAADNDELMLLLGGEEPLLDVQVELKGVRDILAALTADEKAQFPDSTMPIRHFRAEKVRSSYSYSQLSCFGLDCYFYLFLRL